MMTAKAVFVSWHNSRRSRSLAEHRGLPLVVFVAELNGVSRHLTGAARTVAFVLHYRPRTIWFQYSFVLAVVLALYRRLSRGTLLVADVHTKALRRDGGLLRAIVWPVKAWTLRNCDAVIVTNRENRDFARTEFSVDAEILTDPLPIVPSFLDRDGGEQCDCCTPQVAFVCSYAVDEPIDLIRETAELLGSAYRCFITGDASHLAPGNRRQLASVAELTGFIPEEEYWQRLSRADAIVVLTTESACLPCGAYEAIALKRRPVLLDDAGARAAFGSAAIFSAADARSLAMAVARATGEAGRLTREEVATFDARWWGSWCDLVKSADQVTGDA